MSPRPPADRAARPFEVAIVGNDAILASLPSRPMQLAHALLACGFDLVVPVSWGEELLADATLRALASRGASPAVFCACPLQHARLLAAGSELSPYLLTLVPPSVAAARYLRAAQPGVSLRITVVGGCPDAADGSIDARIEPLEFLRLLAERGIVLGRQPAVFESVIPPDRRRFLSLPGGCPAPKALATRAPERRLVTITEDAFATELAEHLLGREPVLVDVSSRLACACCGGFGGREHRGPVGRDEILRHEPPRANGPVLDLDLSLDLTIDAGAPVPSGLRRHGSDATAREEPLPGTPSLDASRQRAERLRIAVTPTRAVPSTRRTSRTGDDVGAARPTPVMPAAPATESPTGPTGGARPADAPPADEDAITEVAIVRTVEPLPTPAVGGAPPLALASASPNLADVVVDRPSLREGMTTPAASDPSISPPLVMTWHDIVLPIGALDVAIDVVAATAPALEGAERTLDASTIPARRRAVSQVYQASRAQGHPRARSPGGKVLPRAYIRHAVVPSRDESDTSDVLASDVEVLRAVAVEPAVTVVEVAEVTAARQPVTGDDDTWDRDAAAPVIPRSTADASAAREDPATVLSGPMGADVLARVRQRPQPASRVIARDVTPPDDERDPGSLAVFIAAAVLVVALLVAIGVVFRHSPTAPW